MCLLFIRVHLECARALVGARAEIENAFRRALALLVSSRCSSFREFLHSELFNGIVCVCPSQWPRGMPRMPACVTTPLFTPTAGVGELRLNFAKPLVRSRDCEGVSHSPAMFTPCSPFHVGFTQRLSSVELK